MTDHLVVRRRVVVALAAASALLCAAVAGLMVWLDQTLAATRLSEAAERAIEIAAGLALANVAVSIGGVVRMVRRSVDMRHSIERYVSRLASGATATRSQAHPVGFAAIVAEAGTAISTQISAMRTRLAAQRELLQLFASSTDAVIAVLDARGTPLYTSKAFISLAGARSSGGGVADMDPPFAELVAVLTVDGDRGKVTIQRTELDARAVYSGGALVYVVIGTIAEPEHRTSGTDERTPPMRLTDRLGRVFGRQRRRSGPGDAEDR